MKNALKKVGGFIKKHKKLTIFIVIVILLLALVLYIKAQTKKAMEMLNNMASTEIAEIERRSLVESLSATGTIVSKDKADIIAHVNNVKVLEVLCEVGDEVKKGDILCVLDSDDLKENLDNAMTNLDVVDQKADASVATAKRGLNESMVQEAVQVDRDYEDAQLRYDDYMDSLNDVDQAKQEYDAAVNVYNAREAQYNEKKDAAQAKYKERRHEGDPEELDEYELSKDPEVSFYLSKLQSAENDMNSKKKSYESAKDASDKALETYNNLIRNYEDHVRNNDSTIMSRNDSLKNARLDDRTATLNTQQQVRQYENQIDECTVTANMDGVITSINVAEGNIYTGSTIATIEDISSYEVSAEIDEYDIDKIKVGQKIVLKTNGTGDTEFEGTVSKIAPRATKATSAAGVATASNVTYKVTMVINGDVSSLKMDMTAKISIIIDEKDDVLTVPYDAVQVDEDGKLYIELYENDSTGQNNKNGKNKGNVPEFAIAGTGKKVFVTKGIESDYYIEVIGEGVKEGLKVIVPKESGGNDFLQMMMDQGAMGGF